LRIFSLLVLLSILINPASKAATFDPIAADPPPDSAHPASMNVVHIASHGGIMNGVLWGASGPGPHPVAIIYHGFPGNEQNLDLAYTLRRAGWSVLTFHYRGSWGSDGTFSFRHVFEDAQTALDFVRKTSVVHQFALDPGRIVIIGHSMGGMAAALIGARNTGLQGVVLISAADFGRFGQFPGGNTALTHFMSENMESLQKTSPGALAHEAETQAKQWHILDTASGLAQHELLVVTADDGLGDVGQKLADATDKKKSGIATIKHFHTDHGYADHRIDLQRAILEWLATNSSGRKT